MGRDNVGADDDPAGSGPLRYIAPGARVLTADDEANPDALATLRRRSRRRHKRAALRNVDATSARLGFCSFSGLSRFAAVALTSSSQVSIADQCFMWYDGLRLAIPRKSSQNFALNEIVEATGLSLTACSRIRAGAGATSTSLGIAAGVR
jgi:hypothetical protein